MLLLAYAANLYPKTDLDWIIEKRFGRFPRERQRCYEADVVYVLHCFQKKSKSGIATPKQDMDLIKTRLKEAEKIHQALYG